MKPIPDSRIMLRINDGGGWYRLSFPELAARPDVTDRDLAVFRALRRGQMFRTESGAFVERIGNARPSKYGDPLSADACNARMAHAKEAAKGGAA